MKENNLKKVYTELFNEETRLCSNNSSSIEFITNKKYILDELKSGNKILELGAATGRYTIMLADKGYEITALEYVEENLEILKSKITDKHKIKTILGNALDLSQFKDESFDVVLNMGPLYHFPNYEDQDKVVKETMRVLKNGGTAFFAFISNDMVFVTESLLYSDNFLSEDNNLYDKETHKVYDDPFTFLTVESIRKLMDKNNCKEYKFIASDGYAELLSKEINNLSDDKFDKWLKYHLYMCEKAEALGASHHLMYITKKQKKIKA